MLESGAHSCGVRPQFVILKIAESTRAAQVALEKALRVPVSF
jgi:hypothetical protein